METVGSDFTSVPSCGLGDGSLDHMSHEIFFCNDYTESSILSQFSWSIQPEFSEDYFLDLAGGRGPVDDCFSAGSSAPRCEDIGSCSFDPVVVSAPFLSSSSSEDMPEKSSASGDSSGVAAGSPPHIA
ncbi:WRKY transcription factor 57 [Orobanche gracilis]